MIRSLNSGVSGLQQFQGSIDVIGNNIANSNTTAYKSARADFKDTFSQTLNSSGGGAQVGSGVATSSVKGYFNQGAISRTGMETDLAINGDGFFMVRDSLSGQEFATRSGDFRIDDAGYMVTNDGLRLQGFNDSALSARGDLLVDGAGRPAAADPAATLSSFRVDSQGKVMVRLSDGTEYARGQVLLQSFRDPQTLVKEGNNLYSGMAQAGPLAAASAPGTTGLGQIQSDALELSNVDLANEFSRLITSQRGFQASARIISTSDEVFQELVNLKR